MSWTEVCPASRLWYRWVTNSLEMKGQGRILNYHCSQKKTLNLWRRILFTPQKTSILNSCLPWKKVKMCEIISLVPNALLRIFFKKVMTWWNRNNITPEVPRLTSLGNCLNKQFALVKITSPLWQIGPPLRSEKYDLKTQYYTEWPVGMDSFCSAGERENRFIFQVTPTVFFFLILQ